jgi:hypothetical protein
MIVKPGTRMEDDLIKPDATRSLALIQVDS